jgi:hypothetical protein
MDILQILESHGVDVEHIDNVPQTWADAIDRLVVDLKNMGWRGHLRSIAAHDGTLEVEFGGDVTPAMLARIARAADEARHVCEECGAASREDRKGSALCSRCATLGTAVAAALEDAPDDAPLGALVYELYCAWDIRRLALRHIMEVAVRSELVDARRYTERVLAERDGAGAPSELRYPTALDMPPPVLRGPTRSRRSSRRSSRSCASAACSTVG